MDASVHAPSVVEVEGPVRVFVACTEAELLPMRVLEFSIRASASLPVTLVALHSQGREIPMPADLVNRPRTPFSFQRFLIPELCGHAGRAIYLDADMLVFSDIAELWCQEFHDHDLLTVIEEDHGRRGQFSVMLLDCAALDWRIESIVARLDAGELDYGALMYDMRVARSVGRVLPAGWNALERYSPGDTRLLHYTDMNSQPWVSCANPQGHLWVTWLRRAIADDFIPRASLAQMVTCGHVRPSLLVQIDEGIDDPLALPASMRALDRGFVAPYKQMNTGKARPWTTPAAAVRALLRRLYFHTPFARRSRRKDSM
ncbi:glycosyltransferase [Methyloversatilis sp. XJ19-49]|uniref:glycosyltransferase n=1 Tax=Methyloversatilis sp. XJ19-49 TaxID=2963429 RepID=UPI00211CDD05|nr:glycosyltransferase [Methyloversatilis sp. XJ19-49]MCQ9378581.1 hypothetical protein [Methyloversatilis sp. XJ19-49]